MSTDESVNYGLQVGIERSEMPVAITFCVIYLPLMIYFIFKRSRVPNEVLSTITSLCLMRIIAYAIRAAIAGSNAAGENLTLVRIEISLYAAGLSALLESAFSLAIDRDSLTDPTRRLKGPCIVNFVICWIKSRTLIRMILITGFVLAAVDASKMKDAESFTAASKLRLASTCMYLSATGLVILVTLIVLHDEIRAPGPFTEHRDVFKRTIGNAVLISIGLLCVTREAFLTVTWDNLPKQNKAVLWYPLIALTELVAVILFAVPHIVPSKRDIAEAAIRANPEAAKRNIQQIQMPTIPIPQGVFVPPHTRFITN